MTSRAHATAQPTGLGYQPALDGLRAVSVIAVILYHAGFGWMRGGFFGVEVFFVISGFLITSLLIDERVATGTNRLGLFWMRRARRLLPALAAMLLAVCAWTLIAGSPEQASQLRGDMPWAVLYVANWGQILGDVPYFAHADPPLLRHLWSLAVEEQWYLVWPLVFVALSRLGLRARRMAGLLALIATAVYVGMWWVRVSGSGPITGPLWFDGSDRINLLYLSTITRCAGLLLGAALAFAWRRWRHEFGRIPVAAFDAATVCVLATLCACFVVGRVTSSVTYPWLMAIVSWTSVVAVLLTVHPRSRLMRALLGRESMAAIGRRSYGLYLWHWPVFVIVGATAGSWPRFVLGAVIAIALSELCYRYLEIPIRHGAIGRLWGQRRPVAVLAWGATASVVAVCALALTNVSSFDVAAGGEVEQFVLAIPGQGSEARPRQLASAETVLAPTTVAIAIPPTSPAMAPAGSDPDVASSTAASTSTTTVTSTTTTTLPRLPRSVAIVGDSQAHSLFVNLPRGIGDYFHFIDGSVSGCSTYESGEIVTARPGFHNDFGICRGWAEHWARAASGADVALVVLGAWDVFDVKEDDGGVVEFGSLEYDRLFTRRLATGLAAIESAGAHAAILEVPCMRPVDARGAGVPALPERGDDARVAHLNTLLRRVAARDPEHVTFVEGPNEWCSDESIATDRDYRWDGVHVYQRGAKLVFETIAPALLAIPVVTKS